MQLIGIIVDIICGQFFVLFEDTVDGKLRTDNLAEIAVNALPRFGDHRRVIAFFIKLRGLLENVIGAEFNTEITPLTAIFNNVQLSNRYGVGTGIKRQSPEFHYPFPSCMVERFFINLIFTSGRERFMPKSKKQPDPF
jgi:hypothetical protein